MSDNNPNGSGSIYAPEAVPMKLAPLSGDLVIRGGDGRNLITFHADGTVTGEVEDANEAAAVLFRELQRLIAETRAAHDAELTERVREEVRLHLLAVAAETAKSQREHDLSEGIETVGTSTANEAEWYQMGNWASSAIRTLSTTPERSNT